MKKIILFVVLAVASATFVSAQQKPTPVDLSLGTSFSAAKKDTASIGEANNYTVDMVFRTTYVNFGIAADYTNNWYNRTAADRLRVRGTLGNTQTGYLGSGTGYYESVYNELTVGYEYFFKADHYVLKDEQGAVAAKWRKEATTHSVTFSERLGFTSEGIKDGSIKAFREHEFSFFGMYAIRENMKTTLNDTVIKSPIDPEDARSFFFDIGYKAEVIGIAMRSGRAGIGIDAGVSYTNMTPFGSHNGWKFSTGVSLNSYRYVGHVLDVGYSYTALPMDAGINEITIKINPMALVYLCH